MSENVDAQRSRAIAIALIGGSFLLRFTYVFLLTDCAHYLVSDMGGYWVRACQRFDGDHTSYGQWAVWPPFFHILLSVVFFLFSKLMLPTGVWLSCVLALLIAFGSFSVYWVYKIAQIVLGRERPALAAAVIYGLTYPIIYFNAFLLSENLAIPLVIASVWLLLHRSSGRFNLLCAGVLLGLASGVRAADVLYAVAFLIYLWASRRRQALLPAFAFALGFGAVVGLISLENAQISSGAVMGLGANGGMNFFMAQCKVGKLISHSVYNGGNYHYTFSHPQFAGEAWRGTFTTTKGLHEQGYFYKLGLRSLRRFATWREDFWEMRKILIGPMFPSFSNAQGFLILDPISKWTLAAVFLLAFIAPPIGRLMRKPWASPEILLLWSIIALTAIACFFFGNERRFLYPTIFAAEIIALSLALRAGSSWRSRLRVARAGKTHFTTKSSA